jgi:hypothetical protein
MAVPAVATGILLVPLFDPLYRVSSSANGIYALMSNINNFTSYPDIVTALKEMDIEASIRILEKLIKELNIKHRTRTLEESLNLLKECIVNIENELSIVHEQMAYNSTLKWKWIPFRSYKFAGSINKLSMFKKQMDNRTQMLFNIIKTNDDLMTRHNQNLDPEISLIEG